MKSPVWVTFYSARGGVGRTTLLAACALELARTGKRVVVADFDLESPGLDIVFPFAAPGKQSARPGVVDYLTDYLAGRKPLIEDYVDGIELPGDYSGRLFVLPAGRCDDDYLAKLDRLELKTLYHRSGLFNPLRALRAELNLTFEPDVVLVDSRTGYSDAALVTLFDFANVVVMVLVPDQQNVARLVPVLHRVRSSARAPRTLLVANKCSLTTRGMRALADIEDKLRDVDPRGMEPLDEEERPFLHKVTFESSYLTLQAMLPAPPLLESQEKLVKDLGAIIDELSAATPTNPAPGAPASSLTDAPSLTPGASDREPARGVDVLGPARRLELLKLLPFEEDDYAENDQGLLKAFFFAERVDEALRPDRILVRGRKGAGKSAIFRLLTEDKAQAVERCAALADWNVVAGHGESRYGLQSTSPAYLVAVDFQHVSKLVGEGHGTWSDFWRLYSLARLVHAGASAGNALAQEAAGLLRSPIVERPERLRQLLGRGGHVWYQALEELAASLPRPTLLVYDHLDAGFGSSVRDLQSRRDGVTGLMQAWTEDQERLSGRLKPKILLREDVFTTIAPANINRWSSRDVELRWEPDELLLCVITRAKLEPRVAEYLAQGHEVSREVPPNLKEFVLIFDERVRPRAKQARTWLTVLSRLKDANGTRFPRDFLRLGSEAKQLALAAPETKRYQEAALMAGDHTVKALKAVSVRRNHDLRDEFPDYLPLLDEMQNLRSPIGAEELLEHFERALAQGGDVLSHAAAAREALERLKTFGVIGDWTNGDEQRLFVPDLYLHGLKMIRAGW
jgi:MinD-like ATPase involved in chromosome partitioning or flagellar assembly